MSAFRRRLMFAKAEPIFIVSNNSFTISTNNNTTLTLGLESSLSWTIINNYPNLSFSSTSGAGGTFTISIYVTYVSSSDGIYSFSISNGSKIIDIYIVYLNNFNATYTEITYSPTLTNGTPLVSTLTSEGTQSQSIIVYINGEYTTGVLLKTRTANYGACDVFQGYTDIISITSPKFNYSYLKTNSTLQENDYTSEYEITDSNDEITRNLFRLYEPI